MGLCIAFSFSGTDLWGGFWLSRIARPKFLRCVPPRPRERLRCHTVMLGLVNLHGLGFARPTLADDGVPLKDQSLWPFLSLLDDPVRFFFSPPTP